MTFQTFALFPSLGKVAAYLSVNKGPDTINLYHQLYDAQKLAHCYMPGRPLYHGVLYYRSSQRACDFCI